MDTVNTMEKTGKKLSKSNIHIAAVGYEPDRIVLTAKKEEAHKVYLLTHDNKSEDKALKFITIVTKQLEKAKIKVQVEDHNRNNIFQIIRAVKNIIEKESDNNIYVNLATGSKLQAIGMMMACMMYNEKGNVYPVYAEAETYHGFDDGKPISEGIGEIKQIQPYEIKIPISNLIKALKIIKKHDKITKKELSRLCIKEELITVTAKPGNQSQAEFASLDKNIISPLEKNWKFISVEKVGRNRYIKLTEDGKNASEFLI